MSSAVTFGRYRLLEPLTKGGMAEVWRAKLVGAASFERPMVIKRILPHLCDDPAFVRMFIAEARLSARLHHPNIVQVFELGNVDGELFMALEHIAGVDLHTLMSAAERPLPPGLCALVAHEVARALAYAHAVSDDDGKPLAIVHRDVSPSNIMLGYDGQVRLCDFGIAKALGAASDRSRSGRIKGKLSYLAPEVLDGSPFDHRADLFAVGVVMHELLTGRRLFRSDDELETMALVRACRVPLPSQSHAAVPLELERVVMQALSRSPAARPASAEELANALRPIVRGLQWGAPELTALLAELVPLPPTLPEPSATVSARRLSSPSQRASTWRPPSRWLRPIALVAGLLLMTAMVLLALVSRRAPPRAPLPSSTSWTSSPSLPTAPAPRMETHTLPSLPASPPVVQPPALSPPPARNSHGSHVAKRHKHKRALDLEHGDLIDKL
jgi:serine/threonine protein kinase